MNLRKYKINGNNYEVEVNSYTGDHAEVKVNGVTYKVEIVEDKPVGITPVTVSHTFTSDKTVEAPLPGIITAIKVKVGDAVRAGQVLAVLEAMKMDNEILAECNGIIASVNVTPGESVQEGTAIVTLH